jgi:predicted TIM-barrel enzyme
MINEAAARAFWADRSPIGAFARYRVPAHLENLWLEDVDDDFVDDVHARVELRRQHHLDRLLELLPDIPAGKLAIAELAGARRDEVVELERAGVDAVIVTGHDIGPLVGDALPEV